MAFIDSHIRDGLLFEASATLSWPASLKEESAQWKKIETRHPSHLKRYFPLIFDFISAHLRNSSSFELYFLKKNEIPEDITFTGPCEIYIFSAHPESRYPAGSLIELASREKLALPYEHHRNHFVGIAR